MKVSTLAARFPPLNVPGAPSDQAYAESQEEDPVYKQDKREILNNLVEAFDCTRLCYLEGPGMPFSHTLATIAWSKRIQCNVPSWHAANLCASVTERDYRNLQAAFDQFTVYGASIKDYFAAKPGPYDMIWLDYCATASQERLDECTTAYTLLAKDKVCILSTTFCSKRDATSPVYMDAICGSTREASLIRRAKDDAGRAGFRVIDTLVCKDNGMLMVTHVVAHQALVSDLVLKHAYNVMRSIRTVHDGIIVASSKKTPRGYPAPYRPGKRDRDSSVDDAVELVPGNLYTYQADDDDALFHHTLILVRYLCPSKLKPGHHLVERTGDGETVTIHGARLQHVRPEEDLYSRKFHPGDTVQVWLGQRTALDTFELLDHGRGAWVICTCSGRYSSGYIVELPYWRTDMVYKDKHTIMVPFKRIRSHT